MTSFFAFLKKEFKEIFKTSKIYVVFAAFLFFGFLSPILAKMMPDILGSAVKEFKIVLPDPTGVDAWSQLLKNMNQMCILIIILLFMGVVSEEKVKGTAILMLTKPLSRLGFLMSKFIAGSTLILTATAGAYGACLYYTSILFPETYAGTAAISAASFGLYSLLILAITIFASSLSRNSAVSGGVTFASFILVSATGSMGEFMRKWSPGALESLENNLIAGKAQITDLYPPLLTCGILIIIFLALTVYLFNKQEL